MKQRTFNAWIYFGLLGTIAFLALRPLIDFNASSPIKESPEQVEQTIRFLLEELEVNSDTLSISVRRSQKLTQYKRLTDSLQLSQSAAQLQQNGIPLSLWNVLLVGDNETNIQLLTGSFLSGVPNIELSDQHKVVSFQKGERYPTLFSYPIDSLTEESEHILETVFGYTMDYYELDPSSNYAPSSAQLESEKKVTLTEPRINDAKQTFTYIWNRINNNYNGPIELRMTFKPEWKPSKSDSTMTLMANFTEFKTVYLDFDSEHSPTEADYTEVIFSLMTLLLLVIFVFGLGIRLIFKGLVEWKRGFVMLFAGILLISLWRGFYLVQNMALLSSSITLISLSFNLLFYALIIGVFTALAYMAWESLARKTKHPHIPLLDALWRGHFLLKDTGRAILYGYAVTGVLLGLFAIALVGLKSPYAIYDSQFGFSEATSVMPFFTITLNALGIALFGFIGHIALPITFIQFKWKQPVIRHVASIGVITLLVAGAGRYISTPNSSLVDLVLYAFIMTPMYFSFIHFGYLTSTVAWWLFSMFLFSLPFFAPSSSYSIIQFLLLIGMMLLPAVLGVIAYFYGYEIDNKETYIPEYEEKLTRQLRVEKEIEIARESQFDLLPKNTPDLPEAMICGFFIPSFEVGGDYYDYFIKHDENGKRQSLAIAVVDVSGKAMKAAIHAVHTSGLLLSRFQTDAPEQVLSSINPFIHAKTDKRTFITCIVAEYFLQSKMIRIANAGHCLPILKRNGKSHYIETPAPKFPLGIRNQVAYNAVDIQLQSGDVVLFYSDGLPEAQNTKGERIGFDAILNWMDETITDEHTSSDICQQIKRKVQTFSAYQMADDTTIVALKIS